MKKSKCSDSQIVGVLKEVEAGAKVADTCRKHGISDACYYQWKSKFAGMEVSLSDEVLDRIDAIVPPGESIGAMDMVYRGPEVSTRTTENRSA